jgi:hypothetical protein
MREYIKVNLKSGIECVDWIEVAQGEMLCLHEPASGQCPEPDESSQHSHFCLFNIHLFIYLPPLLSCKWYFPFQFSN